MPPHKRKALKVCKVQSMLENTCHHTQSVPSAKHVLPLHDDRPLLLAGMHDCNEPSDLDDNIAMVQASMYRAQEARHDAKKITDKETNVPGGA